MFFLSELFLNLGRQIGANSFYLSLGAVGTLIWNIASVLLSFGLAVLFIILMLKIKQNVVKWILVITFCVIYALLLFTFIDLTLHTINVITAINVV